MHIRNVPQAKHGWLSFLSICPAFFWSDGGCKEKAPSPSCLYLKPSWDLWHICVEWANRLKAMPWHRQARLLPKIFRLQHISSETEGLPYVLLREYLGNKDQTQISLTTKSKQGRCKGLVSDFYHDLLSPCQDSLQESWCFLLLCSWCWVWWWSWMSSEAWRCFNMLSRNSVDLIDLRAQWWKLHLWNNYQVPGMGKAKEHH